MTAFIPTADFSHYVDPHEVLADERLLHVSIGSTDTGSEHGYLGVGDENRYASVLLSVSELDELIESPKNVREALSEVA